jgi:uncharacterized protein (DUF2384 family)
VNICFVHVRQFLQVLAGRTLVVQRWGLVLHRPTYAIYPSASMARARGLQHLALMMRAKDEAAMEERKLTWRPFRRDVVHKARLAPTQHTHIWRCIRRVSEVLAKAPCEPRHPEPPQRGG